MDEVKVIFIAASEAPGREGEVEAPGGASGCRRRIAKAIDALARAPRPEGCTKLAGADDAYRIRIGDYRVASEIADKVLIVYIIRVGHRKEVYRGL